MTAVPAGGVAALAPPAPANGGFVDYSTTEGIKLYSAATSLLVDDPLFNCEANGLSHFLGISKATEEAVRVAMRVEQWSTVKR